MAVYEENHRENKLIKKVSPIKSSLTTTSTIKQASVPLPSNLLELNWEKSYSKTSPMPVSSKFGGIFFISWMLLATTAKASWWGLTNKISFIVEKLKPMAFLRKIQPRLHPPPTLGIFSGFLVCKQATTRIRRKKSDNFFFWWWDCTQDCLGFFWDSETRVTR